MAKLALIGYGKMGRAVSELAPEYGFEVALTLDSKNNRDAQAITANAFKQIDAAIEFTSPAVAPNNLERLASLRVPTVTGTTGWMDALPRVRTAFESAGAALVYAPNFSVGVAIFRKLTEVAAELFRDEAEYGAWAWEIHHSAKKDAPSGTLLRLVETMRQHGFTRAIDVSSSRAGRHPGTHEVGFDSAADTVTLRHTARSREGFARGALRSAKWVIGKRGVFTFDDVVFGHTEEQEQRNV